MTGYSVQYLIDAKNKLSPVLAKVQRELKAIDKTLKAMAKPIKLKIDTRSVASELKKLQRLATIKAKISADFAKFKSDLAKITKEVITIKVILDLTRAKQQLRAFQNRMARIRAGLGTPPPSGAPPPPTGAPPTDRTNSRYGKERAGVFGALAIVAGVQDALTIDESMMRLEKATNATAAQLKKFKQIAIQMESQNGIAAASILDMTTEASKAGIATKNLERVIIDQIKTSIAWDMSIEDTSERLTHIRSGLYSSIKDFDMQQDAVMRSAAAIAYLSDKTEASEYYLANYMGRTAGLVTAFGQTEDAVLSAGAAFQAIGIAPEVAARAMNSAAAHLAQMSRKLKADSPILKILNTDLATFRQKLSKDMVGTMFEIAKAIEPLDNLKKIDIMTQIFGVGFADELIRLGSAQDIYIRNLGLAGEKSKQAATIQEQYNIKMKYMTVQVDAAVNGLKTLLGLGVAPYLDTAARAASGLIEVLKANQFISDFAMAIAFAAVVIGVAAAATWIFAAAGGLLLIKIAALIYIFVKAYENSETLRTAFGNLGNMLTVLLERMGLSAEGGQMLAAAFTGIGMAAGIALEVITQIINTVGTLIDVMYNLVTGDFGGAWDAFNEGVKRAEESVKKLGTSIKNDLQGTTIKARIMQEQAGISAIPVGEGAEAAAAARAASESRAAIIASQYEMATKTQEQAAREQMAANEKLLQASLNIDAAAAKLSKSGGSAPAAQPFFYGMALGSQGR